MLAKKVYTHQEKATFAAYFQQPDKKRKRGRPKKRKRKKKCTNSACAKSGAEIERGEKKKARRRLFAKCQAVVNADKQRDRCRINWDVEPHKSHRDKLAQSWLHKNDLYEEGESFGMFCKRQAIDRNVLKRYLQKTEAGTASTRRGRPTFLSESVMRHICESTFISFFFLFFVVVVVVFPADYSSRLPITNSCGATRRTVWGSSKKTHYWNGARSIRRGIIIFPSCQHVGQNCA